MVIHEYQAKEILRCGGVLVPRGALATSARDAMTIAESLGGQVVVKAQILAGGRGAGGGIRRAASPEEASRHYEALLGTRLITTQTGASGLRVHRIYIEETVPITQELYLALTLDRARSRVAILASASGGIDVEKTLVEDEASLLRTEVDPIVGPSAFAVRALACGMGLSGACARKLHPLIQKLYKIFVDRDCTLLEINPLVVTSDDELLPLDCKMNFDDGALFRQPEIMEYRDIEEGSPEEFEALKYGLSYVRLDGDIGCIVNGAGLAMATCDAIILRGGTPANFLDLGGSASRKAVQRAFEIVREDQRAKVCLVNIFGGIVRCDEVAVGIAAAMEHMETAIPLVVRLNGNNAERGHELLADAGRRFGYNIQFAGEFGAAVEAAVGEAAGIVRAETVRDPRYRLQVEKRPPFEVASRISGGK